MTSTNDQELSAVAQTAWEAYSEMSETKETYHGFLMSLDDKYDKGEKPSDEDNERLATLLNAHSAKVAVFNEAMRAVTDADDRTALLKLMS